MRKPNEPKSEPVTLQIPYPDTDEDILSTWEGRDKTIKEIINRLGIRSRRCSRYPAVALCSITEDSYPGKYFSCYLLTASG
jgi:hypothetical protein